MAGERVMVRGRRPNLIDIAGEVRIDRPASILFFDGDREVWLPKSLIVIDTDGTVAMPEWLAMENKLI